MNYARFLQFNIIGGVTWVVSLTLLGYFFGNLPFVQENFETVIFGIIFLSIVPMIVAYMKAKLSK
jgi:membrane-associated protein